MELLWASYFVAVKCFLIVDNTESVAIQLAVGFSEAFCGGVLAFDSIGNLMTLHFFGPTYGSASLFEKNLHILSLWGGIIIMGILGIWA